MDGRTLAFTDIESNPDIWLATVGDAAAAHAFLQTEDNEQAPTFAPDGRRLAYVSNETGRREVYVQSFPDGGSKRQISTDGGSEPVWSADGRQIFYRNGDTMMVVDIENDPVSVASRPRVLFEQRFATLPFFVGTRNYDVTADGERFLMIKDEAQSSGVINIVLNWFEELKARVPLP